VGERFLQRLNSDAELEVAARKTYEELAQEALAVKESAS
jgi:hypothetical protein